MDHIKGFSRLKECIQNKQPSRLVEITTLEARFLENERIDRLFGSSENTKHERNRIIYTLNEISLRECGISYVDMCLSSENINSQLLNPNRNKGEEEKISSHPSKLYGTGKKWAVIVGVNEYEDKNNYGVLQVCLKDAHALSNRLQKGGFEDQRMHILADDTCRLPTRTNILESLKAVANASDEDDLIIFYYSGHGDLADNEPYLVARDGRSTVLPDTGVPLTRVKQILEGANARAKVMILDACHSGANIPGKGAIKMTREFIKRVFEQAEGFAIIASCKQHELSYEWLENEQSVFTHYLLDALDGNGDRDGKKFVTIQDANRHVSDGVRLWASINFVVQTPTFEYKGAGDIILVNL